MLYMQRKRNVSNISNVYNVSGIILRAVIFCAACAAVFMFTACKSDPDKGRIPFSPRSGIYEIMLKPESQWAVIDSQSINSLSLYNTAAAGGSMTLMVTVECYGKTDLANLNVSDTDGFIKFYKTFDYIKGIYESDKNTAADPVALGAADIKNTQILSGKRQQIYIKNTNGDAEINSTTEFIYLETKNYYFAISYNMPNENLTDGVKTAVNDLIFHIREKQSAAGTTSAAG